MKKKLMAAVMKAAMVAGLAGATSVYAVSYTHLDVYKRKQ